MISINDVDCEYLYDFDTEQFVLTRWVKHDWNSMSAKERNKYWTTKTRNITLDANILLGDLYDKIEDDYHDDGLFGRLWEDTTDDFVDRCQALLNEICNFHSTKLQYYEAIDPRIDLEEVQS